MRIQRPPDPSPACTCPVVDGAIRHLRQTCADPVVAELGWYYDRPRSRHDPDPQATHQAWMNQVMHAPTPVCPEHPDADLTDEAFSFWCPAGEHAVSYAQVRNGDTE